MAFHCRLTQIGRGKSKPKSDGGVAAQYAPPGRDLDLDDNIPF